MTTVGRDELRAMAEEPTDAEQAVRDLHERAWNGELDYCPRCLDYEGAIWPCATIQALDDTRPVPGPPRMLNPYKETLDEQ